MGQNTALLWTLVIVVIVIGGGILLSLGIPKFGQQTALDEPTAEAIVASCDDTVSPTITFQTTDAYQPGTALSTNDNFIAHRLKGTEAWTYTRSGNSVSTYSVGDKVEYAAAVNSSTLNGQYGYWMKDTNGNQNFKQNPYVVECKEAITLEWRLSLIATPSNFEVTLFNSDLVTSNAATAAQALEADQVRRLKLTVVGHNRREYGSNPAYISGLTDEDGETCNGYLADFMVNRTAVEAITFDKGTTSRTPEQVSVGSTNKSLTFEVAPIQSTNQYDYLFDIDTFSAVGIAARNSNFTIRAYDCHTYVNSITNEIEVGAEDDSGNSDIGTSTLGFSRVIFKS